MTNDPDWRSWASGDEHHKYQSHKTKLDVFMARSSFWKDFWVVELPALRKKYNDETAVVELKAIEEGNNVVAALVSHSKRLIAMAEAARS